MNDVYYMELDLTLSKGKHQWRRDVWCTTTDKDPRIVLCDERKVNWMLKYFFNKDYENPVLILNKVKQIKLVG